MNINKHNNLTLILQFLAFLGFFGIFFMSMEFLKHRDLFSPALFLIGPVVSVILVRLVLAKFLPASCSKENCDGSMFLSPIIARKYQCNTCGTESKIKQHKHLYRDDQAYRERLNKLLIIVGAIILVLVLLAIYGAIKNSN